MEESLFKALLAKYRLGTCSEEERVLLESWYLAEAKSTSAEISAEALLQVRERMLAEIGKKAGVLTDLPQKRVAPLWPRIAAAAAILLFLSGGLYWYLRQTNATQFTAHNYKNDVAPGKDRATLTLADGRKIPLSKGLRGQLARRGSTLIGAGSGQAITYTTKGTNIKVEYNTLSTARGEQSPYPLVLDDGTKVWLNAASSVTFPTAFTGDERKVTVTGEVLFEVVHNAARPFRVSVKGQTIEDIGTAFDINAYADEPALKITLLEGSAQVSNGTTTAVLKPGQRSVTPNGSTLIRVEPADLEEATAWHRGMFHFHKGSIKDVMRQMSRWYDVEVSYEGRIPPGLYTGDVYRNMSAAKVLEGLTAQKVHFRIEGKKIIITP